MWTVFQVVLKGRCITGEDILKELEGKDEEERKTKERVAKNKADREKKKQEMEKEKEERYYIALNLPIIVYIPTIVDA